MQGLPISKPLIFIFSSYTEAGSLLASMIVRASFVANVAPYPLPAMYRSFFLRVACLPRNSLKATIASEITV